jgi:hypothetical protein
MILYSGDIIYFFNKITYLNFLKFFNYYEKKFFDTW